MTDKKKKNNLKCNSINVLIFVMVVLVILLFLPSIIFKVYTESKVTVWDEIESVEEQYDIGIVFGAGTYRGEPNRILRDRLDTAADLYKNGYVQNLLLSGSNIDDHEEVYVMYNYLIREHDIDINDLQIDGYGLRTFDTCKRAYEVYDISKALIITSTYHVPRSIFLCENAGIESYGVGSSRSMYTNGPIYVFRELLATYKALIDTTLLEPEYSTEIY